MKKDKDNVEKNAIEENLKQQFQNLNTDSAAPEDLKKEVFSTLDTITLFSDVLDLFTAKFSESEAELIDLIGNPDMQRDEDVSEKDSDTPDNPDRD